ncbi:tRNA(Ile2) C34 agmatinyltransferase TiaS [Halarchaeum rubridurum]|uniref:tRNA(Ile2) C34 agmatinyltransferase TiaS n=1 Tax=Halarchaeum rubridurum TaxID=489911 RepID=A0A830FV39_9EURY|nr:hypothetical protein [Halarchaeum rubridurum]MBP1953625.1 tRNA(Ile2) C34 agmatinyltransferase TiaS [Halarchaeum rubridurum]GGM63859.1 hypothetical protein GCM10009017_12390 [Halarchaeum rubridurum]
MPGDAPHADVAPMCTDCDARGARGNHKGDDVLRCPECDDILYRPLAPA